MMGELAVFISHSHDDMPVARALIEMLRSALNLTTDEIRCTSVSGYKLKGGARTDEQLRQEICETATFIGLLTKNSLGSTYVLFELGARWGKGMHLVPLVAAGLTSGQLQAPLASLNALSCEVEDDLYQLVDELGVKLGRKLDKQAAYKDKISKVIEASRQRSEEEYEISEDDNIGNVSLSDQQIDILKILALARDQGYGAVSEGDLADAMEIGSTLLQHHLSGLIDCLYVYAHYSRYETTSYSLKQRGITFLVEHGHWPLPKDNPTRS